MIFGKSQKSFYNEKLNLLELMQKVLRQKFKFLLVF